MRGRLDYALHEESPFGAAKLLLIPNRLKGSTGFGAGSSPALHNAFVRGRTAPAPSRAAVKGDEFDGVTVRFRRPGFPSPKNGLCGNSEEQAAVDTFAAPERRFSEH